MLPKPTVCPSSLDEPSTGWAQGKQNACSEASTNLKNFSTAFSASHRYHISRCQFDAKIENIFHLVYFFIPYLVIFLSF